MKRIFGIIALATILCTSTVCNVAAIPDATENPLSTSSAVTISSEDGEEDVEIEDGEADFDDDEVDAESSQIRIKDGEADFENDIALADIADEDTTDDSSKNVTTIGTKNLLIDEADLLSDDEETALQDKLNEISKRVKCDIVIVTTESLDGKTAQAYADDYYDDNGYKDDGVLLLIAKKERKWAMSTSGFGITALTNKKLNIISDKFTPYLSNKQYQKAFTVFADKCDEYITEARNKKKGGYDVGKNLLLSLGIGIVVAVVSVSAMAAQLKSVKLQESATDYVKTGSLRITQRHDVFLYRTVEQEKIEHESSGGSSTHTSSSGRTHGGSSGSF